MLYLLCANPSPLVVKYTSVSSMATSSPGSTSFSLLDPGEENDFHNVGYNKRKYKISLNIATKKKLFIFVLFKPNHPKSSKILQGALFLKEISTVGNWYFHLFKWGKNTTWQEVQAISAEYERSTKIHGPF